MAPAWRAYATLVGFSTGGSNAVRRLFAHMRTIGAAARVMLIETAADRWQVAPQDCYAELGSVHHAASKRQAGFGELAVHAARRRPPADPPLKARSAWRLVGRSLPRVDTSAKVDGTALYGMDLRLPGMLIAAVEQSPWPGARVTKFDRSAVRQSPGVVEIVELDDTIAVLARDYWHASQGLKKAAVQWTEPAHVIDTAQLRAQLRELVASAPRAASVRAIREVEAVYEAPLLLHMQLEPLNATARVERFSAEVWAPTQNQGLMQSDVARAIGVWAHAVTVNTPLVGGGFGRRLDTDYGVTAARIAKQFDVPIKAVWSRDADSIQGHFRPMCAARLTATLADDGTLRSLISNVASIGDSPRTGGLRDSLYRIAEQSAHYSGLPYPIRTGSWRSVNSSQNIYFRECFIDECAQAAAADPLHYRHAMLENSPRARRVLETVARISGWNDRVASSRFLGVAFSEGFGSLCAHVVEVAASGSQALRVVKIYAVVDCGTVINPDGVRAQMQGAILFGLSAALYEEITYQKSQLNQTNFDTYRVLRINEAPDIEIRILETPDAEIGGMGEVGVPPVAPAMANAIFAATAIRVRRLPLSHSAFELSVQ